ncbi:hypothetical protein GCM10022255_093930 [Dactylosporangium darangshiense]|uniref:RNA polymerase sigma-70 region 2 domain-containing protein n=1 Tax=Dactylosporangium darangshiense TaxID=579108 RepID=A0ABP8DPU2_9ACTN
MPTHQTKPLIAAVSYDRLIVQIADRKPAAFVALYRLMVRPLFLYSRRRLGDAGAAVLITRAVFVEVWRLASTGRRDDAQAWLRPSRTGGSPNGSARRADRRSRRPPTTSTSQPNCPPCSGRQAPPGSRRRAGGVVGVPQRLTVRAQQGGLAVGEVVLPRERSHNGLRPVQVQPGMVGNRWCSI